MTSRSAPRTVYRTPPHKHPPLEVTRSFCTRTLPGKEHLRNFPHCATSAESHPRCPIASSSFKSRRSQANWKHRYDQMAAPRVLTSSSSTTKRLADLLPTTKTRSSSYCTQVQKG